MDRLTFLPDASSYSIDNETQHYKSNLDGPISLYRKGILTNKKTIACTWHLTQNEWLTFFTFFTSKWQNVETFLITLFVKNGNLVDFKAKFIQNSFKISNVSGDQIIISISLEIDKL